MNSNYVTTISFTTLNTDNHKWRNNALNSWSFCKWPLYVASIYKLNKVRYTIFIHFTNTNQKNRIFVKISKNIQRTVVFLSEVARLLNFVNLKICLKKGFSLDFWLKSRKYWGKWNYWKWKITFSTDLLPQFSITLLVIARITHN